MRIIKHALWVLFAVVIVAAGLFIWLVSRQGLPEEKIPSYITIDEMGIPTVEADDWKQLIERQGFAVASERMWQMDLLRRYASGRLAEWFGGKAVETDIKRTKEDWLGVADRAVAALAEEDLAMCQAYARGVNRFIEEGKGRWGLEYVFLRDEPDAWECRDSLLVVLYMASYLTSHSDRDVINTTWREILTDEWFTFIFPHRHPWADPMFGRQKKARIKPPPLWQALPEEPFSVDQAVLNVEDEYVYGSNAWASTSKEHTLLAGDPHLRFSVPQLWYAMRLRVSSDDWVVGGTLPGIPGITIGMNSAFAWSFTNTSDDSDDVVEETLNADGDEYLADKEGDLEVWRRVFVKHRKIKIRGAPDQVVEISWTHRGPIIRNTDDPEKVLVRQWAALKEGVLGLPVVALNRATDFEEANHALDRMGAPSQSFIYADRRGNIGYRATGVMIERRRPGNLISDALEGEWVSFGGTTELPRVLKRPTTKNKLIVNANAQVWVDKQAHYWATEDRRRRIQEMLGPLKSPTVKDFQSLQLDVQSEFHRRLVGWVLANDEDRIETEFRDRMEKWKGFADSDPEVFTFAAWAEKALREQLIDRVRRKFADDTLQLRYRHRLDRAWLLRLFEDPSAVEVFGTTAENIVEGLWGGWQSYRGTNRFEMYFDSNSLTGSHPFYGTIPLIGAVFRIKHYPQFGYRHLVRSEDTWRGPSLRVVYDLKNPGGSTWSFPLGQSGHVRSQFYRNWQTVWSEGNQVKMLTDEFDWGLVH